MSETWINLSLRRSVEARAGHRCEYCGIRDEDTYFGCHIDHIISEKHGGSTQAQNLALACAFCNRAKGSDIAALDDNGTVAPLFHPRKDLWDDHFQRKGNRILGITSTGQATVRLLKFNAPARLDERSASPT